MNTSAPTRKNPDIKILTGNILLCVLLVIHIVLQWPQLHADIWNDEMYTLVHFVLVPLKQTVTDYHVPNNHIFFSIAEKIFLKISGHADLSYLLDHPAVARIPGLIFSGITIIYTYLYGKKYFSVTSALISTLLLITTIPFYNFALQIRGYSLSMMFSIMLLYHLTGYLADGTSKKLPAVILSTALLLYTIPSNYYLVLPLIIVTGSASLITALQNRQSSEAGFIMRIAGNRWSIALYCIMCGILLSLLFYLPVIHLIFSNHNVSSGTYFNTELLTKYLPETTHDMMSERKLLLLPLMTAGLFALWHRRKIFRNKIIMGILSLLLMLLPFVVGYIRGDAPPNRVFIFIVPLFVIFLMPLTEGVAAFLRKTWQHTAVLCVVAFCCFLSFRKGLQIIDRHLYNNLTVVCMEMGLYYNYFAMHFHPAEEAKYFKDHHYSNETILVIKDSEPGDMPYYLQHLGVRYYDVDSLDTLMQQRDSLYVITRFPPTIKTEVLDRHPGWEAQFTRSSFSYHNFVLLRKAK